MEHTSLRERSSWLERLARIWMKKITLTQKCLTPPVSYMMMTAHNPSSVQGLSTSHLALASMHGMLQRSRNAPHRLTTFKQPWTFLCCIRDETHVSLYSYALRCQVWGRKGGCSTGEQVVRVDPCSWTNSKCHVSEASVLGFVIQPYCSQNIIIVYKNKVQYRIESRSLNYLTRSSLHNGTPIYIF